MENKTSDEIKAEFKKERGISAINSQGEPDIDYVEWLENKYATQSIPGRDVDFAEWLIKNCDDTLNGKFWYYKKDMLPYTSSEIHKIFMPSNFVALENEEENSNWLINGQEVIRHIENIRHGTKGDQYKTLTYCIDTIRGYIDKNSSSNH